MDKIYTITRHFSSEDNDQVETFVAITKEEAFSVAYKMRQSFKEEYFDDGDDDYDEDEDEGGIFAWSNCCFCNLEIWIKGHRLSYSNDNGVNDIEDSKPFNVGKDFINTHYMVISDSGYVYTEGDIITTLSLAKDFLEGCNGVEEADLISYVHRLLQNNKGEELVKFICEAWDGLILKKIG